MFATDARGAAPWVAAMLRTSEGAAPQQLLQALRAAAEAVLPLDRVVAAEQSLPVPVVPSAGQVRYSQSFRGSILLKTCRRRIEWSQQSRRLWCQAQARCSTLRFAKFLLPRRCCRPTEWPWRNSHRRYPWRRPQARRHISWMLAICGFAHGVSLRS